MATEADNVEELRSAVRDATECHFEEGECSLAEAIDT